MFISTFLTIYRTYIPQYSTLLYNQSRPKDCSEVNKQITVLYQACYFSGNVSDLLCAANCFECFPMTSFVDWWFWWLFCRSKRIPVYWLEQSYHQSAAAATNSKSVTTSAFCYIYLLSPRGTASKSKMWLSSLIHTS